MHCQELFQTELDTFLTPQNASFCLWLSPMTYNSSVAGSQRMDENLCSSLWLTVMQNLCSPLLRGNLSVQSTSDLLLLRKAAGFSE